MSTARFTFDQALKDADDIMDYVVSLFESKKPIEDKIAKIEEAKTLPHEQRMQIYVEVYLLLEHYFVSLHKAEGETIDSFRKKLALHFADRSLSGRFKVLLLPQKDQEQQIISIFLSNLTGSIAKRLGSNMAGKIVGFSFKEPPTHFDSSLLILHKIVKALQDLVGFEAVKSYIEKEYKQLVFYFGNLPVFDEILRNLPENILVEERLGLSKRLELEKEVKIRTLELEEIKATLEQKVLRRTLALSAERNKLQILLNNVADAIFAIDFSGNIVLLNRAASVLLDVKEADALEKPLEKFISLADNDGEVSLSKVCPPPVEGEEKVLYSGQNLTLTTASGKTHYVNIITSCIKEGKQIGISCIGLIHDVTAQRELEEMKLDFVSIAAHELRTPITAIRGYVSELQLRIEKKLDPQEQMFLERVAIGAVQLLALVENILSVAKIERGTLKLDLVPTSIPQLIDQTLQNFQAMAKEKEIAIKTASEADLPAALIDAFKISEVINNLVSNAINYTPNGGNITISLYKKGDFIVTEVKDTGVGIAKVALPRLFTRFYRAASKLSSKTKGTGLGLYIAKSIIELHKGEIWVESHEGRGSTFYFSLPIAKGEKAQEYSGPKSQQRVIMRKDYETNPLN